LVVSVLLLPVGMVAMNLGYFLLDLSVGVPWSLPMRPVRTPWRLAVGVDGCCAGVEAGGGGQLGRPASIERFLVEGDAGEERDDAQGGVGKRNRLLDRTYACEKAFCALGFVLVLALELARL
jgi:hypothetical protein